MPPEHVVHTPDYFAGGCTFATIDAGVALAVNKFVSMMGRARAGRYWFQVRA